MTTLGLELWRGLADLIFPPCCLLCREPGESLCIGCLGGIYPSVPAAWVPAGLADATFLGDHEGALREAVLQLKFHHRTTLARPLAGALAVRLEQLRPQWQPDLLTPVPLHWVRYWQRGFNQAELLTREVAHRTGVPWANSLARVRATPPQVGQSAGARARNLHGAFASQRGRDVTGLRVVLIDDVTTTGATLAACAIALRAADAAEVYALTVTGRPTATP